MADGSPTISLMGSPYGSPRGTRPSSCASSPRRLSLGSGFSSGPPRDDTSPRRGYLSPQRSVQSDLLVLNLAYDYTSPRRRSENVRRQRELRSIHDAAWEGDVAGMAVMLEQAEDDELDLNKPGYLKGHNEGLRLVLDHNALYQMKGYETVVIPKAPRGSTDRPRSILKTSARERPADQPRPAFHVSMKVEYTDPPLPPHFAHRTHNPTARAPSWFAATPLIFAAANGHTPAVEWLLRKGANPNTPCSLIHDMTGTKAVVHKACLRDVVFACTFWKAGRAIPAARELRSLVLAKSDESAARRLTPEQVASWFVEKRLTNCDPFSKKRWTPLEFVKAHNIDGCTLEQWMAVDWKKVGFERLRELQRLYLELVLLMRYVPPDQMKGQRGPSPTNPPDDDRSPGDDETS